MKRFIAGSLIVLGKIITDWVHYKLVFVREVVLRREVGTGNDRGDAVQFN